MRRPFLLIPLLAFGTVAGFASGLHSLHHRSCHGWNDEGWRSDAEFAPPAPAPVIVQAAAPAPAPIAPAPSQTLVIPIIIGAGSAQPAQPTTYLIQVPTGGAPQLTAVPVPATAPSATPAPASR